MDAFVIRTSAAEPSRSSSVNPSTAGKSKRLPPSSTVPSFFSGSKPYDRTVDPKGKGKETPEPSTRQTSVPAAHSTQLKKTVQNITKSLKSADNPITNSNAYSSTFHYVSCSSGHEVGSGRSREANKSHALSRNAKLKNQSAEAKTGVLKGVRAYINGITTPVIGNLDLIRLIQENGGDVKYNFCKTGCTHVVCTRGLSASKTHKEMSTRSNTKVVTPEWILDSISEGKKLAESRYRILESETQHTIKAFAESSSSSSSSSSKLVTSCKMEAGSPSLTGDTSVESPIFISSSQ